MANSRLDTKTINAGKRTYFWRDRSGWLMPGLLLIIIILLALILIRGWDRPNVARRADGMPKLAQRHKQRLGGIRGLLGNKDNHIVGSVSAVNGASFTVNGNGTTTTVNTDSNTKYWGSSSQVKVNDSVAVIGANTNGTIAAKEVIINP